jgi:hypothetical protein
VTYKTRDLQNTNLRGSGSGIERTAGVVAITLTPQEVRQKESHVDVLQLAQNGGMREEGAKRESSQTSVIRVIPTVVIVIVRLGYDIYLLGLSLLLKC